MARLSLYIVFICTVVALGSYGYGFGFGVFVSSVGLPGFFEDLNLDPTSDYTAKVMGATFSLFAFGAALGDIVQGWTSDWIGRKKTLAVAGITSTVGAALVAGSVNIAMLVTTRIIHGFGLGMMLCLVPIYGTEIAPPKTRGIFSGMTVIGYGMGYLMVAWISVATYYATNKTHQWRLPLALATVGPLGLLLGLPFIPESPRYLCWIDRFEEAHKILLRLHRDPDDSTNSLAEAEFLQIKQQVQFDRQEKAGYIQPSWRKRAILVMFLLFASQATGVTGISNYLIPILTNLGFEGGFPLIIYAIYSTVGTVFVWIVTFSVDRVGRRRMFLLCYPILAVILLIEGLLQRQYIGTSNRAGNIACVVMMNVYLMVFQLADSATIIWASEVLPTTIRAKGTGLAIFSMMTGFVTFSAPGGLAFKNLQWGMFLIFAGLCVISSLIIYFFIPETKGIPVEEIGGLFGDPVVVHLTADAHGIVAEKVDGPSVEFAEVVVEADKVSFYQQCDSP